MKKLIIPFVVLLVILILYGFFVNPKGQILVEKSLNYPNLPNSFDGFKIVQFSDLLIGSTKSAQDVKNIVKEINDLKPDIIVFTGDLISNGYKASNDEIDTIKKQLKKLNPNMYKYAIMGDNDIEQIEVFQDVMKYSDFIILDNESTYLFYKDDTPIKITGITNTDDINKALEITDNIPTSINLVLTHYPDLLDTLSSYDIDLILAGHSLKGQIKIPFYGGIMKKDLAKKYLDDYYNINKTKMYVSGGLGTEEFQFRFLNKPEINLYRLIKD